MKDPWQKGYVYARVWWNTKIAHVVGADWEDTDKALCGTDTVWRNRTPKPYPVCKNCLRTKRAKELGVV
jgi:hypothetical protein